MTNCEYCKVPFLIPCPFTMSFVLRGGWRPPCIGMPKGKASCMPLVGCSQNFLPFFPWPKPLSLGGSDLVVLVHRRPNAEQTLEHPWFKVSLGSDPMPRCHRVP